MKVLITREICLRIDLRIDMNRIFLVAKVLTASLFFYSCNSLFPESEEHLQETIQTIYASGEERPGTRNAIDNETFEISWTTGDAINVFFGTASSSRFVTEESGAVAKFKGSIDVITGGGEGLDDDTSLWGVYPYDSLNTCEGASVTLSLPAVQQSAENTFAPGIWPTVACSKNFYMSFYNVCGAFRFTVYHDNIKKVTLSGNNDEELAGRAKVSLANVPLVEEISFGEKTITMSAPDGECFKPGVNYYLVVYPTAFSNGMTLTFYTEDSYASYVYSKSYTLNRSSSIRFNEWDKELTFMALPSVDEKVYTDLSAEGTANCYLVSQAGDYKFKAFKGNTGMPVGDVNTAEVLWESFGTDVMPNVGDMVSDVSFKDGYEQFSTPETFANGNAVIVVKDANGDILWSWHIWCSEEGWQEHVYYNNAGTMMDRNLGATSATPGSVGALGLLYQWGRKDPFLSSSSISSSVQALSTGTWETSSTSITNALTISNPTTFFTGLENYLPDANWQSKKTAYDPCPFGWRVPDGGYNGIWRTAGFADTSFDSTNRGISFSISSPEITWYPASGSLRGSDGVFYGSGNGGYYWSVAPDSVRGCAYRMYFGNDCNVNPANNNYRSYGHSVRCLKTEEEIAVPASVTAEASDIQYNSATISGILNVQSDGSFSKSALLYYSSSESTLDGLRSNGKSKTLTLKEDGSYSAVLSALYSSSSYNFVVVAKVDDVELVSTIGNFLTPALPSEPLVDLGLSVKWASCNLGASKPTDYGGYYQWAGTEDVSDTGVYLEWSNCPYHTGSNPEIGWTKYIIDPSLGPVDNKTVLETMDDAASVALGGKWRMPTIDEWKELVDTTNCTRTETYIDRVYGYKVQSKKPGYTDNWIFLPAAGYRNGDYFFGLGHYGYYWSSSLYTGTITEYQFRGYNLGFNSTGVGWGDYDRYEGHSVRPVSE